MGATPDVRQLVAQLRVPLTSAGVAQATAAADELCDMARQRNGVKDAVREATGIEALRLLLQSGAREGRRAGGIAGAVGNWRQQL